SIKKEEKKITDALSELNNNIQSVNNEYENNVAEINKFIHDKRDEAAKSDNLVKKLMSELSYSQKSEIGLLDYVAGITAEELELQIENRDE
ncbi:hypothetical protein G3565_33175, partial [Escherichia coli]|nr:hypothetical protein [Escherichia coli]